MIPPMIGLRRFSKGNWPALSCAEMLGGLFLTLLLCSPVEAQRANEGLLRNAETAYQDINRRFWMGTASTGHLAIISQDKDVVGSASEIPAQKGWLWQYAEGWNPIYAYWKTTKSSDAKTRLIAEWHWVLRNWSIYDLRKCGEVGGQAATTQDDSSWVAMGLLQLYEATGDARALSYAKEAIDCAYARWHDEVTGGGLWYDDRHNEKTGKSVSNGNFALAMLKLYDFTCSAGHCHKTYLQNAAGIANWAAARLRREDGLYWMSVNGQGVPNAPQRPNDIAISKSVVALFGNMAFAALDTRLYELTKDTKYRERLGPTANSISRLEARDGVFIDDRDARGNAYAAWDFAHTVVRYLDQSAAMKKLYADTGQAVVQNDRAADGSYGGDWSGPVEGVWAAAGFHKHRLEITGNAVMWPIAAAEFR